LYYDNGAGAKNNTWDDALVGLAARLSITKFHSAPWSSQARGVIERFNSSVLHKLARWFPTYCGQRMDDEARRKVFQVTRKVIKATGTSRLLPSWRDLMDFLADTMVAYNAAPHSSLAKIIDPETGKRRHMSPNEAWAAAVAAGWVADPVSEEEARDLFRPVERRIVQRGLVKLFNNDYYADELVPLHGQEVAVGFDIHDAKKVSIRLLDGRFVCEAKWNANHRDYMPVAFVERARERRVEGKLKRLDAHRDVALAELPSAEIIQHQRTPDEAPVSLEEQARLDAMEATWEALPAPQEASQIVQLETRETRFRRALTIQGRLTANAAVSDEDAAWLARYQALPEYRALSSMYEEFGDAVLTA
ncbi:Mu transposase C-terminal domain-containing protein, partial [Telmatospirillum sp.]|uniref:Mu transposase C-terminal domain-containing protein n=1 Tax=Telmatospirillum sp. TaxID=2079197 RepID=UPI00283B579F